MSASPDPTMVEVFGPLADLFLQAGPPTQPFAVGVRRLRGELELAVKELTDPDDPLLDLVGFDAPSTWDGFGIVAPGSGRIECPSPCRTDVTVVHFCDRSGHDLTALGGVDVPTGGECSGRVPDLCRRVLGLRTAPPEHGPESLFDVVWALSVLTLTLDCDLGAQSPSWNELAATHPAATSGVARTVDGLIGAAATLAERTPWPILRRQVASGVVELDRMLPTQADWMDDGMFARWVLGSFPDLGEVMADLDVLLPASVATTLRSCLLSSGW